MPGTKEIRVKIRSVQNTRKITKAMEMVAASKMKKSQERMRATRPYVAKALQIAMHVSKASAEYRHPFLEKRASVKRVGVIVVTAALIWFLQPGGKSGSGQPSISTPLSVPQATLPGESTPAVPPSASTP